jgi:hypothetical protein
MKNKKQREATIILFVLVLVLILFVYGILLKIGQELESQKHSNWIEEPSNELTDFK